MKNSKFLLFPLIFGFLGLMSSLFTTGAGHRITNEQVIVPIDTTLFTASTVDSTYLKAVTHLKSYEGFSNKIYIDVDGSKTIGYGHHLLPGEYYKTISEKKATAILIKDLDIRLDYIQAKYKVTGDTLLALALFSFNCGTGTLAKAIKNGILIYPKKLLSYCHYKTYDEEGNVIWHTSKKLLKRRKYELTLITTI